MNSKNLLPRALLLIVAVIPFLFAEQFYLHFTAYLTGNIISRVIIGNWPVVIMSILLFLAFLIPLSYRRKANWAEYGLATAFFVSLFIEMYGIPLTILFASRYFYSPETALPENLVNLQFLGTSFAMDIAMIYGAFLIILGAALILIGWVTLYQNVKKAKIVTCGIYSYSRHPQYLGFILIIIGWLIGWPTILTLILSPILVYMYLKVANTEEEEMKNIGGYAKYKKKVPFFV